MAQFSFGLLLLFVPVGIVQAIGAALMIHAYVRLRRKGFK